jgi:hypothetical protein
MSPFSKGDLIAAAYLKIGSKQTPNHRGRSAVEPLPQKTVLDFVLLNLCALCTTNIQTL